VGEIMKHPFHILLFSLLIPNMVSAETEQGRNNSQMTHIQAVILGAVEGFTEYLPVSSTGHLILAQRMMGIGQSEEDNQAADAYSICIQAGAILAVLTLYFPFMLRVFNGFRGRDPGGLRIAKSIVIAFLPAAVIGLIFHNLIKEYLFGLWPIVLAWFVGGIAILALNGRNRGHPERTGLSIEQLTWKHALTIGLMQCIAMWPGTSRSLVTIVGGLIVGMSLKSAVIFSFLLGVVTLTAATAYDTLKHGPLMMEVFGFTNIAVGFVMATITAIISVKWFIAYLQKHGLAIFGYYRAALAVIVAVLILSGLLSDRVP
jgi:undecaprenyl-diphosphatase